MVDSSLTPNEFCVLALLNEQPRHGWALSDLLEHDGEIGAIWAIARPLVYTSLRRLESDGYIKIAGLERGSRGPHRVIYAATPKGRSAARTWLKKPVERVRDIRSLFLLKVVLSKRRGLDVEPLLVGQRALLAPFVAFLEARFDDVDPATEPAEEAMLYFRLEMAKTTVGFIDHLLDAQAPKSRAKSTRVA